MSQTNNKGASDDGASSSLMYHTDPEVTAALGRIEQKCDSLIEQRKDHEVRLRSLEKWRWGLAGAFAVLAGLLKGLPAWLK